MPQGRCYRSEPNQPNWSATNLQKSAILDLGTGLQKICNPGLGLPSLQSRSAKNLQSGTGAPKPAKLVCKKSAIRDWGSPACKTGLQKICNPGRRKIPVCNGGRSGLQKNLQIFCRPVLQAGEPQSRIADFLQTGFAGWGAPVPDCRFFADRFCRLGSPSPGLQIFRRPVLQAGEPQSRIADFLQTSFAGRRAPVQDCRFFADRLCRQEMQISLHFFCRQLPSAVLG